MKEVVSMYIGQAGVQIGSSMWELFCAEHHISYDGSLVNDSLDSECLDTLFHHVSNTTWVPRSLFVDLEPTVVDEIRHGMFRSLFHPDRLISGPEDAANNFSRGFFTVGKLLLGRINEQSRHLFEQCDMVQGILILRSLGGGTGAGLTSAMFEGFSDYPKTPKIEIPIYPSPTLSTSMVEPYNCLLGEHFCMEDIDIGLLLDNEAMFEISSKFLSLNYPTYNTINRMIAQVVSSITASVRFVNVLNCDLTVLQTNMVPYPRIHFPLCSFAPMISEERANHQDLSVHDLTRMVFDWNNQMMKVDHFYGKFMSCALFFRGNICPHHVYMALSDIKRDHSIEFVDWCPTGFKVGINAVSPVIIPDSKFANTKENVAMLTNTSAIGQAWQRLTHRFYLLYSKRSFVHWFVGEGMEECEFTEALYNISALVKDYEEAGENTTMLTSETTKKVISNVPDNHKETETKESSTEEFDRESSTIASTERSSSNSAWRSPVIQDLSNNEPVRYEMFSLNNNLLTPHSIGLNSMKTIKPLTLNMDKSMVLSQYNNNLEAVSTADSQTSRETPIERPFDLNFNSSFCGNKLQLFSDDEKIFTRSIEQKNSSLKLSYSSDLNELNFMSNSRPGSESTLAVNQALESNNNSDESNKTIIFNMTPSNPEKPNMASGSDPMLNRFEMNSSLTTGEILQDKKDLGLLHITTIKEPAYQSISLNCALQKIHESHDDQLQFLNTILNKKGPEASFNNLGENCSFSSIKIEPAPIEEFVKRPENKAPNFFSPLTSNNESKSHKTKFSLQLKNQSNFRNSLEIKRKFISESKQETEQYLTSGSLGRYFDSSVKVVDKIRYKSPRRSCLSVQDVKSADFEVEIDETDILSKYLQTLNNHQGKSTKLPIDSLLLQKVFLKNKSLDEVFRDPNFARKKQILIDKVKPHVSLELESLVQSSKLRESSPMEKFPILNNDNIKTKNIHALSKTTKQDSFSADFSVHQSKNSNNVSERSNSSSYDETIYEKINLLSELRYSRSIPVISTGSGGHQPRENKDLIKYVPINLKMAFESAMKSSKIMGKTISLFPNLNFDILTLSNLKYSVDI